MQKRVYARIYTIFRRVDETYSKVGCKKRPYLIFVTVTRDKPYRNETIEMDDRRRHTYHGI